jgi:hypothetical protein
MIKKINENTWRVFSENGKNMGTYKSEKAAKKRLRQIEFFKHLNSRADFYSEIVKSSELINTYSAYLRDVNKKNPELIIDTMKKFKEIFDKALIEETPLEDIESVCLLELQAVNDKKL